MNTRSQLFLRPPVWFHPAGCHHPHIPLQVESWLFETGSLTRRLRLLCGAKFQVRLLRQDRARPFSDEALALAVSRSQLAVVREVVLQCGDRPLVAARSVIPVNTLRHAHRGLARLGTRPLGELLFADPRLRRRHLEVARIDAALWQRDMWALLKPSVRTFGRRSLYTLGPGRLLVAEFFLPALFDLERNA